MTGAGDIIKVPHTVQCYRVNPDGSYEDVSGCQPDCYITDSQVSKLWDRNVQNSLIEKFGRIIGVMCDDVDAPKPPLYHTFKYILGG